MPKTHQVWPALFIAIVLTVVPAVLSAQSENNDPCQADPFWDSGSDPVYSDAVDLGRILSERGFAVECIRSSKQQHSFQGQKGAAWFKTNRGIFDVLFLPKGQNWNALEVVAQPKQDGRYGYSFGGTPQTGQRDDSSKPMWFIKHENALFSVWGNRELAESLEKAFQDQQQAPTPSAEREAYQTAHDAQDPETKIELLDNFVAKYPGSDLLLYVYQDYYLAYFSLKNYARAIAYADELVALGDKADVTSRMLAIETREMAYSVGWCDLESQTPGASEKARDAAVQGLQMLDQWQEPANLTSEQFSATKTSFRIILDSVAADADSRLDGRTVACYRPPRPDPGRFDRIIEQILSEQRQAPQVR